MVDFPGGILAPGFIDIHIHGGGGHDVMEAGADALPPVERLLASPRREQLFPHHRDCSAGCDTFRSGAAGGRDRSLPERRQPARTRAAGAAAGNSS